MAATHLCSWRKQCCSADAANLREMVSLHVQRGGRELVLFTLAFTIGNERGPFCYHRQYEWYINGARRSSFQGILQEGLRPQVKEPSTDMRRQDMSAVISRKVICVSPYPRKAPLFINTDEEAFKLAVAGQSLPSKIGVDWSHGGCGSYCSMHDTICDAELGKAFVDVVKRMASFVSYRKILASALRVCPKSNPDAPPSAWPEFLSTSFEEVHFLQPDFAGNVRL
jgi:hypothetical protein